MTGMFVTPIQVPRASKNGAGSLEILTSRKARLRMTGRFVTPIQVPRASKMMQMCYFSVGEVYRRYIRAAENGADALFLTL